MKREHKGLKDPNIILSHHFSIFSWKQCCICERDFRREKGFKFTDGPYHGGAGRQYYICKSCAPTKDAAIRLINSKVYYPPKPKAPPPPPVPNNRRSIKNDCYTAYTNRTTPKTEVVTDICDKAKEKAKKYAEIDRYLSLCLQYLICPKCGADMHHIQETFDSDCKLLVSSSRAVCESCGFSTTVELTAHKPCL